MYTASHSVDVVMTYRYGKNVNKNKNISEFFIIREGVLNGWKSALV